MRRRSRARGLDYSPLTNKQSGWPAGSSTTRMRSRFRSGGLPRRLGAADLDGERDRRLEVVDLHLEVEHLRQLNRFFGQTRRPVVDGLTAW